jgi:hypothetical protein
MRPAGGWVPTDRPWPHPHPPSSADPPIRSDHPPAAIGATIRGPIRPAALSSLLSPPRFLLRIPRCCTVRPSAPAAYPSWVPSTPSAQPSDRGKVDVAAKCAWTRRSRHARPTLRRAAGMRRTSTCPPSSWQPCRHVNPPSTSTHAHTDTHKGACAVERLGTSLTDRARGLWALCQGLIQPHIASFNTLFQGGLAHALADLDPVEVTDAHGNRLRCIYPRACACTRAPLTQQGYFSSLSLSLRMARQSGRRNCWWAGRWCRSVARRPAAAPSCTPVKYAADLRIEADVHRACHTRHLHIVMCSQQTDTDTHIDIGKDANKQTHTQ